MDLVNLPREILAEIFSLDGSTLSKNDIFSARLTCRELAEVLTPILFYSIRISPLIQDRDDFLNIAKRPHLASLVRAIVWEELSGDLSEFDPPSWDHGFQGVERPFYKDLTANAKALFWLQDTSLKYLCGDTARPLPSHLEEIRREFQDAIIHNMPNVCTFVSRRMNPRRQIKLSSMNYEISVQTITRFIQKDENQYLSNFGFHFLLVPTLKRIAQESVTTSSTPKITQLLYADETIRSDTSLKHLSEVDSIAFSKLQYIDLCIISTPNPYIELTGFLGCLGNADSLTTLKICQEMGVARHYGYNPLQIVGMLPTFPKLVEVHFMNVDFDQDGSRRASMESEFTEDITHGRVVPQVSDDSTLELGDRIATLGIDEILQFSTPVQFIHRHAKTLRRVYFTASGIRKQALKQLASLNSLHLERFVVISDDDFEGLGEEEQQKHNHISERAILNYVNKVGMNEKRPLLPYGREQRDTELHTHHAIFDNDAFMGAAVFDTRGPDWEERGYEPSDVRTLDSRALHRRDEHGITHYIGMRRTQDTHTGLWIDVYGVFYDPSTDEEIDSPVGLYRYPDDSWITQGNRVWDPELGLWRNEETGRLSKYAVDREHLGRADEHDNDFDTSDYDMRSFYEEEDDGHWLRVEEAPRWDWGRDKDNNVWYWQLTSGRLGHATEMWKFEHKGEHAYGQEPLEFWDDWYNEAEDRAEAIPFGWRLASFVSRTDEVGSEIPQQGINKTLTLYERSKDPMFIEGKWWKYLAAPTGIDHYSQEDWYHVCKSVVEAVRAPLPEQPAYYCDHGCR